MDNHSECMAISRWLLLPNQNLSLVNKIDTPTFYQTLAGVTHLDEGEIVELEKRFWVLAAKNKDKSNRIDINSLRQLVSPPMPTALTTAFFQALDENQDGHIDFKELCCGVSAACRGPDLERQKCKKKIQGIPLLGGGVQLFLTE
jgi:ubiquitin carboxyl-terminal hydrolase 6/32